MSQIRNKTALNAILIFSILALIAAYFVQYVLGHKPCNLCLIERVPYIFAILIIFLSLILKKRGAKWFTVIGIAIVIIAMILYFVLN